jgi:hypothetical protein
VIWWVHAFPRVCLTEAQVVELFDLCAAFVSVSVGRFVRGVVHSCGKRRQADDSVNFYVQGDTDGSIGTEEWVSGFGVRTQLMSGGERESAARRLSQAISDGSLFAKDPQLAQAFGSATVSQSPTSSTSSVFAQSCWLKNLTRNRFSGAAAPPASTGGKKLALWLLILIICIAVVLLLLVVAAFVLLLVLVRRRRTHRHMREMTQQRANWDQSDLRYSLINDYDTPAAATGAGNPTWSTTSSTRLHAF